MNNIFYQLLLLFFTALFYCYLPLMIRFFCGKLNKKNSIIIIVINSIIVYLLFASIINISSTDETTIAPNITATLIWSFIGYIILRKNNIDNDNSLYDKFPKVLPAYSNNKRLTNRYIENLEFFIENDKLLYKVNPYNNKEINDYDDIREYYKQYLSDKIESQQ